MRTLKLILKNQEIYTFEDGSYDRYVLDDKMFIIYLEDIVQAMFNVDVISEILFEELGGGFIYD